MKAWNSLNVLHTSYKLHHLHPEIWPVPMPPSKTPPLCRWIFVSPHPRSTELKWTPGEELQRRSPQAKSKWRPASPLTELKSRPDRTRNEKLVDNKTEGIQCKQLLSTSLGAIIKRLMLQNKSPGKATEEFITNYSGFCQVKTMLLELSLLCRVFHKHRFHLPSPTSVSPLRRTATWEPDPKTKTGPKPVVPVGFFLPCRRNREVVAALRQTGT